VAPGKYQARLIKDKGEEKITSFTIFPDPRINAGDADYLQQQQSIAEIDNKIKDIHDAVNQMRLVRKQVNELIDILTDTIKYKPIIDSGKSLIKKLTAWEEKLVQPKAQSNDDIINFVNMLSANYIFVKAEMDVNIPAVTAGQQQRITELNAQWQPIKTEYNDLQKQVADYNALCRSSGIEKITVPEISPVSE
jgi:cell division protein FtsB